MSILPSATSKRDGTWEEAIQEILSMRLADYLHQHLMQQLHEEPLKELPY